MFDDLINRINETTTKATENKNKLKIREASSGFYGFMYHWITIRSFIIQFLIACHWIWTYTLGPLFGYFWQGLGWIYSKYKIIWSRFVYIKDEFGIKRFSKKKAGLFLASNLVILFLAIEFVAPTVLYILTAEKNQLVYLTNSQEIFPDSNIWSVQGCLELPCTDNNSIYYRVKSSWFNETWSILHGKGLFFADFVAGAVPIGLSECLVTSYGFRFKLFVRWMEFYPDLISVECHKSISE